MWIYGKAIQMMNLKFYLLMNFLYAVLKAQHFHLICWYCLFYILSKISAKYDTFWRFGRHIMMKFAPWSFYKHALLRPPKNVFTVTIFFSPALKYLLKNYNVIMLYNSFSFKSMNLLLPGTQFLSVNPTAKGQWM
jgi:hypothetical protein